MRSIVVIATSVAVLTLAVACSDPTGDTPTISASAVAGGDGQSALVGTPLDLPLRVKVLEGGAPKSDVQVSWQSAGGALIIGSNLTDADGEAVAGWVLPNLPGAVTATATVDGVASPVTFHATALDYVTATIEPASEGQSAMVGTPLGEELVVTVRSGGVPQANVSVVWSTTSGSVTPGTALTAPDGVARARWTLGPVAGSQSAYASVARTKGGPLAFHATATPLAGTMISKVDGSDHQSIPANFPGRWLGVTVTDAFGNVDAVTPVIWSVLEGPVTLSASWTDRFTNFVPSGPPGIARVRAVLSGTGASVDFTVTVLPAVPLVILDLGEQTGFLSRINGTSPAVDTIPAGGAMTWLLSYEDLDYHAVAAVGLPTFVGGGLGYGGTRNGLTITFGSPGTYHYEDPYWPGVIGTLVVQ